MTEWLPVLAHPSTFRPSFYSSSSPPSFQLLGQRFLLGSLSIDIARRHQGLLFNDTQLTWPLQLHQPNNGTRSAWFGTSWSVKFFWSWYFLFISPPALIPHLLSCSWWFIHSTSHLIPLFHLPVAETKPLVPRKRKPHRQSDTLNPRPWPRWQVKTTQGPWYMKWLVLLCNNLQSVNVESPVVCEESANLSYFVVTFCFIRMNGWIHHFPISSGTFFKEGKDKERKRVSHLTLASISTLVYTCI